MPSVVRIDENMSDFKMVFYVQLWPLHIVAAIRHPSCYVDLDLGRFPLSTFLDLALTLA